MWYFDFSFMDGEKAEEKKKKLQKVHCKQTTNTDTS